MHRIVLIRHGQSMWNVENRFTGWTDVDLTEDGYGEARKAGGRGKQQILQVARKHLDCLFLRALAQIAHQIKHQVQRQLHAPGPARDVHQPPIAGKISADLIGIGDHAHRAARADR